MAPDAPLYQHVIGLGEQAALMALKFPGIRYSNGTWTGKFRPSLLSVEYTVRIAYRPPKEPEVRVVDPPLAKRPDCDKIEHVYPDGSLCLYYPDGSEWSPERPIWMIVPWIVEWLWNYEGWLVSGDWNGGGVHPERV